MQPTRVGSGQTPRKRRDTRTPAARSRKSRQGEDDPRPETRLEGPLDGWNVWEAGGEVEKQETGGGGAVVMVLKIVVSGGDIGS